MTTPAYEKLGAFYLGKEYDPKTEKITDDTVLYDSKDLTTHAFCVGMTGSGKTGLCLSLLEEAAIDQIPALIVDPKGDLGNLLLTFPNLLPADFKPWIDPAEAVRAGKKLDEYAVEVADRWKKGLADWDQAPDRIAKFKESVDISIYTPGSTIGIPLTVLRSFTAPPPAIRDDIEALRERITSAVSGLLALLDIDADPVKSKEHILLSNILDQNWRQGTSVDLPMLIAQIQRPPMTKVGFLDLESFYPEQERFELAMQINNMLASPGFARWLEGEPLDIQRLLYTKEGKPRMTILSISHLSDQERMFFVTILLSELVGWMRMQAGTSSLRAIFYMDEIYGYFPPSKNPPSKPPMMTLLKQARAFGLGMVMATQNPVDLDYKGLSNCGTWFIGRLQTERDKDRVLDGLEGASAAAGQSLGRADFDKLLSSLGRRVFLLHNTHEDHPVLFQTRWALSYLRGPLTREQTQLLMGDRRKQLSDQAAKASDLLGSEKSKIEGASARRPVLPPSLPELFLAATSQPEAGSHLVYKPGILSESRIHYANAKAGIDHWQDITMVSPVEGEIPADVWQEAKTLDMDAVEIVSDPDDGAHYASLPDAMTKAKSYTSWTTSLKANLYRTQKLSLYTCDLVEESSTPGEKLDAFRSRIRQKLAEERDLEVEKLRKKYSPKITALHDRMRTAEQRVEREKQQAGAQKLDTMLSVGATVLGALFGRKMSSSTVTKTVTTIGKATKMSKEATDIAQANETAGAVEEKIKELNAEFEAEVNKLQGRFDLDQLELTENSLTPKKSDIVVNRVCLVWVPWLVDEKTNQATPAYG